MFAYLLDTHDVIDFIDIADDQSIKACQRDGVFAVAISFERVKFQNRNGIEVFETSGLFEDRHPLDVFSGDLSAIGLLGLFRIEILFFQFAGFESYLQARTPSCIHPLGEHYADIWLVDR